MDQDIEQRFQKLEEDNKKLRLEIERTRVANERNQAINEIRNIMGTLQAWHTVGMDVKIGSLFANRPDCRVYFGEIGSFEGADCSDRAGSGMPKPGHLPIHLMGNPVIEVAEDGQTAQAIFVALGIDAEKDPKTGEARCRWEWNRYGDDFIKEDGKWKLWHHHVYPLIQIGWNEDWAEHFEKLKNAPPLDLPFKPDHPATPLDVFYNPDEKLPYIPVPEPYKTWNPKQMY